jgi:hypothetical protein
LSLLSRAAAEKSRSTFCLPLSYKGDHPPERPAPEARLLLLARTGDLDAFEPNRGSG